jgi:hypothetical protein
MIGRKTKGGRLMMSNPLRGAAGRRLGDGLGLGEGDGDGEGEGIGVGESAGVGEAGPSSVKFAQGAGC